MNTSKKQETTILHIPLFVVVGAASSSSSSRRRRRRCSASSGLVECKKKRFQHQ
jgi:hypothetical protein